MNWIELRDYFLELTTKQRRQLQKKKWYHATLERHLESLKKGIRADYNTGRELDFGAGFYITSDFEQACKYINAQVSALNNGLGSEQTFLETSKEVGIVLEFYIENFEEIFTSSEYCCHYFAKHKQSEDGIDFAEFVFENRIHTEIPQHQFDFIYGVQTDDNPTQVIVQYEAGELSKQEVLENFRQPYSFKQLSIHNQEFCDIMKIDKVYLSDTGKELDQW